MIAIDTMRPVMVGVDGSDSALRAVRWAAGEARARNAPLSLVHAFHIADAPRVSDAARRAHYRRAMLARARSWLSEAADAARGAEANLDLSVELRVAHPAQMLARNSARAQLLVLGDKGLSSVRQVLIGSVAAEACGQSACPSVVVRTAGLPIGAAAPAGERAVVVGVDGSAASESALAFAFEYASAHRAPLKAVHTWWDGYLDASTNSVAGDVNLLEQEAQRVLAERLAGWGEKYPEVPVRRIVEHQRPCRTLRTESQSARLVVVGSRGRGGFAGWPLGSTSQALLHHAHCPVAVVPSDGLVAN